MTIILPPFFGTAPKYEVEEVKQALVSYLSQDIATFQSPSSNANITFATFDTLTYAEPTQAANITYFALDTLSLATPSNVAKITYNIIDVLTYDPPPEPPEITRFTFTLAEDAQIYAEWNTPYDNRSPITGYSLEYALVPAIPADPSTYTYQVYDILLANDSYLLGLTNDQDYVLRVCALNDIGAGPYGYSDILTPVATSHNVCDITLLLQPNSTSSVATAITDLSCRIKPTNNVATIGLSSNSAFGAGSLYFDGTLYTTPSPSTYPHITVEHDHDNTGDDWSLHGDFTIECWIRPDSSSASSNQTIASYYYQYDWDTVDYVNSFPWDRYWKLYRTGNSIKFKMHQEYEDEEFFYVTDTLELVADGLSLSTSAFTHIAVSRFNNYLRIYIDGILYDRKYFDKNLMIDYTNNNFMIIGGNQTFNYVASDTFQIGRGIINEPYIGYIDDFMISSSARYAKNFTPLQYPTPLTCTDCGYVAAATSNHVSSDLIP